MKGERRAPDSFATRRPGRRLALALAILVHAAFIGVLVWSVRWQVRPPEVISAELYAPPVRAPRPDPVSPIEPPKPVPKLEPRAEPLPLPPTKAERHDAEIALKAKQDEERRQRDKVDHEKREREKKAADEQRAAEERRMADEKKAVEARERHERETEEMRVQAEREAQQAAARVKAKAENDGRTAAQADWIRRIQSKIRGNVVLPPEMPGNPEAIFEVVQLPTGEIIDVQLRKSSGFRAYDEAVQRAILKSSPLPRPDRAEMFSRALTLRFRPLD
ncbi:MAG: TonB C-terminal domain-containing protein [Betaproteobacteria bacterium]